MSLQLHLLGGPARDNALLVVHDSGQSLVRILFDCGEGCLNRLDAAAVQGVDALCFSHLHMDHVAGFDRFFRMNFDRPRANRIFGPEGTGRILQHRFQGYLWNHLPPPEAGSVWQVTDVLPDRQETRRYRHTEGFAREHAGPVLRRADGVPADAPWSVYEAGSVRVESLMLDHGTPCLGWKVQEAPRWNVDPARLAESGLPPGPWLRELREKESGSITVGGAATSVAALRARFMVESPGESAAYLSDFLMSGETEDRLAHWLQGCGTIVCESQYAPEDGELAVKNHHLVCTQAATLARRAGAGRLVLIHFSDRYAAADRERMLRAAQEVFPQTSFPDHW